MTESLKAVKLIGLVDLMHLQDLVNLHDPTRTISFSFCELDGYEFFLVFASSKIFFHSFGVEDVHVRFDEKSVGC